MTSARASHRFGGITTYLVFFVATVSLGPLQFGFHLAELNAPEQAMTCHETATSYPSTLPPCIRMSKSEFAFISSIFTLGGLFGALSAGPISTRYGRLLSMRIAAVSSVLGSSLEALAGTPYTLMIGRFLSGIGAGMSLVVVPLYISEIAPPDSKGLFGAMTQIAVNLGILVTLVLGYFFGGGAQWRVVMAAGAAIALFQGAALCFVAESPAWLATNRDFGTAVALLQRVRGKDVDIDTEIQNWSSTAHKNSADELESLLDDPDMPQYGTTPHIPHSEPTTQIGYLEVMRNPLYRSALIAVVGVMAAQQFTGINSVMMYSDTILSPLFPTTSTLLTIFLALLNLLLTIFCSPLPDFLGRKPTLLLSITGMGLSSFSLAFGMLFNIKVLTGLSAVFFIASFGVGLGAIPFILASELVDQEAAAATQGWGLAANWIATFCVSMFCPLVNDALNARFGGTGYVYFVFAALALASGVFVAGLVPETRGRKNEEVWERA